MKQILKTDQIALNIEYMQSVNYTMLLNGGKVITDCYIKNLSGHRFKDLNVSISGFYFPLVDIKTGPIEPDEMLRVSIDNVIPDLTRLQQQNEGVYTEIKVSVTDNDNRLGDFRVPITIQAWNNWVGNEMRYQELASFVMPHHSYVAQFI